MARTLSSASKVEIYSFHPLVVILTPVAALTLQTYLPLYFRFLNFLDLPLLVVIYFGLARRNPLEGIITGALIGMAQDGLTRGPIGFLGGAKTVVGFVTTLTSVRFAVENSSVRGAIIFSLYYLHFFYLYAVSALLLGQGIAPEWGSRFVAALVNTGVGVLTFNTLDRFKRPA